MDNHAYPPEVRKMIREAIRHARTGNGSAKVLKRISQESERIRKAVLKKHGVLNIGVPAIRELRE